MSTKEYLKLVQEAKDMAEKYGSRQVVYRHRKMWWQPAKYGRCSEAVFDYAAQQDGLIRHLLICPDGRVI